MSLLTVKGVWPGERAETLEEFRNSSGGAFQAWDCMAQRYLHTSAGWLFASEELDRLWPLCAHKEIPAHQRAVLSMTYDNTYVLKQHYGRAAQDIRDWLQDFPDARGENHWPALAGIFARDPEVPAIGFWWTNVGPDPFDGDYDEDNDVRLPLVWSKFWSLYDEFYALEAELKGLPRQLSARGPLVGHLDTRPPVLRQGITSWARGLWTRMQV
jgi:hypothetical protein